jgi:plasmid stabilization system protein ParE
MSDGGQRLLSIHAAPSWELVDHVRTFVTAYCGLRYPAFAAERIALASHELLENAVRFGSISSDIEYVLVEVSETTARVEVTNEAVPARVRALVEHVQQLRAVDAARAYAQALRTAMGQSGVRMLGLARVRHEAGMEVEVRPEERRITVVATGAFGVTAARRA